MLQELGAYGIDADALARRAIGKGAPGYERLVRTFGEWILDSQGQVDFDVLAQLVLTNPRAEEQLREIAGPIVIRAIDLLIQHARQEVIVIEATTLLGTELAAGCEAIWTVYATPEQQIKRLIHKHHFSEMAARHRLADEPPQSSMLRKADIVIFSDGSVEDTQRQVHEAWSSLFSVPEPAPAELAPPLVEEIPFKPDLPQPVVEKKHILFDETWVGEARSPLADVWLTFRRNKAAMVSGALLVVFTLIALLANWLAPYDIDMANPTFRYKKPFTQYQPMEHDLENCHWLGTILEQGCMVFLAGSDSSGRDILTRTIYGTRVSMAVALVAAGVSLIVGTVYGMIAGYLGGRLDEIMMRVVDFLFSIPIFMAVIVLEIYFRSFSFARYGFNKDGSLLADLDNAMGGLFFIFLAIGALNWVDTARVARGQVYAFKHSEFVLASRVSGASEIWIIVKHLLPNIIGPLIVVETLAIPGYIFLEAALSFVGLGVIPPTPSWGAMLGDGYKGLRSNPHLIMLPAVALTLLTLAFNFIGDGLRDAFDTTMRGRT